jgi:hypothetical protein
MSTFTDDDLKRFKYIYGSFKPYTAFDNEMCALLARLEAAERVILETDERHLPLDAWQAWRKAAGK